MYLCEACYYFDKAEDQIDEMRIFDEKKCNQQLVEEIGRITFLSTLNVFENGVKKTLNKLTEILDCKENDLQSGIEIARLNHILHKIAAHKETIQDT